MFRIWIVLRIRYGLLSPNLHCPPKNSPAFIKTHVAFSELVQDKFEDYSFDNSNLLNDQRKFGRIFNKKKVIFYFP